MRRVLDLWKFAQIQNRLFSCTMTDDERMGVGPPLL